MSTKITKTIDDKGRLVMSRLSTIEEQGDRSFDIEFWQQLTADQRADAVWELVVLDWKMKGKNPDELRLQRSVGRLRKSRG